LSGRPIPELPATPAALAEAVRERYRQIEEELDSFFAGVDDAAALYKRGPDSWSAAEVLAHLVLGERQEYQWIANLISGHEPWQDDWGGNDNVQVAATVSAYPTVADLLGELKSHFQEKVAYLDNLPADVSERKGSFWRLAYNLVESPFHFHTHLEQMREAIAQAPQPVP
jgi:hypothetical protein